MQNPILKLKEEQKERAKEIKDLKFHRPLKNRGDNQLWQLEMKIARFSYTYRHNHIVYCEFKGRKREEIERNVREGNKADEKLVEMLKEKLYERMEKYNEQKTVYIDAA